MLLNTEQKNFLEEHSNAWRTAAKPLVDKMVNLAGSKSLKAKIEDAIYSTAFAIHCKTYDGFEMLRALLDEENLADLPTGAVQSFEILDIFPEDHILRENETFKKFRYTMLEISNKGKGKAELLSLMILKGAAPSIGDEDVSVSIKDKNSHIEVKADNATLKGTPDASLRVLDAYLDEHYPGQRKVRGSAAQFETDDISLVEKMLECVYELDDNAGKRILECYAETAKLPMKEKIHERKQAVGFEIMRKYKLIDGFDTLMFFKSHERGIHVCVINDISLDNKKEICDNINFKPQTKRGGGTQAVGDGYTDAELRLQKEKDND
jgi:hypothetical protein